MKNSIKLFSILTLFFTLSTSLFAQENAVPVFKDGEAQIVKAFEDPKTWIRHDLWVQTTFDTDGDGKLDRVHVSVTRPAQTKTEKCRKNLAPKHHSERNGASS